MAESGLSWYLSPDLISKRTQEQRLLLQGGVFAFVAFAILEKLDETVKLNESL